MYMQTFAQYFLESQEDNRPIVAKIFKGNIFADMDRFISNEDPLTKKINKDVVLKVDENHLLHSNEGPAYVKRFINGNVFEEIWAKHGYMHRLGGPARKTFDYFSNKLLEQYFVHGRHYSKEEFDEYAKDMNKEELDMLSDLVQPFD
jgi:hypothetical protein